MSQHRATDHDAQFVTALMNEHGRAMLGYATRLTGDRHAAEDVVQETLIRAWRSRESLASGQGSVRGWLLTVIRNLVIDRARARAARPTEVAESAHERQLPTTTRDPASQVVDNLVMMDAIGELSPEHRSVLLELYYRGSTVTEAASALGVPAGTVKSRSFYALRQLRAQLEPASITW